MRKDSKKKKIAKNENDYSNLRAQKKYVALKKKKMQATISLYSLIPLNNYCLQISLYLSLRKKANI